MERGGRRCAGAVASAIGGGSDPAFPSLWNRREHGEGKSISVLSASHQRFQAGFETTNGTKVTKRIGRAPWRESLEVPEPRGALFLDGPVRVEEPPFMQVFSDEFGSPRQFWCVNSLCGAERFGRRVAE